MHGIELQAYLLALSPEHLWMIWQIRQLIQLQSVHLRTWIQI